jgi:sarcosine oxidase delta subunit
MTAGVPLPAISIRSEWPSIEGCVNDWLRVARNKVAALSSTATTVN